VSEAPPATGDREGIVALRDALDRAGYDAAGISRVLEGGGPFKREPAELPYYLRLLPDGEPFSALARLFLLDVPVPADEAARALEPLTLERVAAMNVLRAAGDHVESLVDVVPTEEVVLASDRWPGEGLPPRLDHVYGLTPPARTLASLVAWERVGTALDLGTGSGLLALLGAPLAERMVALDLNPRALRFAEFNAVLNGVENVDLREGDMLEPVEGGPFDLVVSNPPYVISPGQGSGYIFRDTAERGDRFCERLIGRIPALLAEGGLAYTLVSWPHEAEGDWSVPLRPWVEGTGCDALLVRWVSFTPIQHAAEWNRSLRPDPEAYAGALDRWLEYYAREGIERVGWGAVVLRKRSGARNWVWAETPAGDRLSAAGHHVLRVLANRDFLERAGAGALLDLPLRLADDHLLDRVFRFEDGEGAIERSTLRLQGGFGFGVAVDLAVTDVLARLDGERTLREALGPADDDLVRSAAAAARRLVELGLLLPAAEA
jgi:SAM-dependent methyltransferase